MAKNGRRMFNCPTSTRPITKYEGEVAVEAPAWVDDPDAILADEIDDEDECAECGQVGTLIGCEGQGCDRWYHHQCAQVDPAHEPEHFVCALCAAARG
jgi:hypothetical protein